jgi:hypothetical protein
MWTTAWHDVVVAGAGSADVGGNAKCVARVRLAIVALAVAVARAVVVVVVPVEIVVASVVRVIPCSESVGDITASVSNASTPRVPVDRVSTPDKVTCRRPGLQAGSLKCCQLPERIGFSTYRQDKPATASAAATCREDRKTLTPRARVGVVNTMIG